MTYRTLNEALSTREHIAALVERLKTTDEWREEVRISVGNYRLPEDGGLFMKIEIVHIMPCNPWHRSIEASDVPPRSQVSPRGQDELSSPHEQE